MAAELDMASSGTTTTFPCAIFLAYNTPVTPAPLAAAPPRPSVPVGAAGERRHLTMMFCDLVGSTEISAHLDAEEWRDLVGAYLDAASAAVTEMGGHVAKKLGDGLMSQFGYPVAQENDSERAVRAALSIQRASGNVAHVRENAVALSLELTSQEIQVLDAAHPLPSR
jgi:class 3 adenylate cyclase